MTLSGTAGPPEGDGAFPTRRQARALREAAAADAPVDTRAHAHQAAPAIVAAAMPVPPVPLSALLPDLAVVVQTAPLSRREARARATVSHAPDASARTPSPADLHVPGTAAIPVIVQPNPPAPRPGPRAFAPARARSDTGASHRLAPARRRSSRRPVAKVLTLLAIPALFLTAALPAYAFSPLGGADGTRVQAAGESQALSVASAAAAVTISTDGFTATSQAELDDVAAGLRSTPSQEQAAEEARASAAAFAVYGLRAEGDDYPWPTAATDAEGGGLSPLGYYYRECVDFVAWRLNRDAGSTAAPWTWTWHSMTPGGGDASSWPSGWAAKGWPTSKSPVVGAVAWFTYNHVAYVQSVPGDGTVVLEEYNWMGLHSYHTRTVPISSVPLYLYPPT